MKIRRYIFLLAVSILLVVLAVILLFRPRPVLPANAEPSYMSITLGAEEVVCRNTAQLLRLLADASCVRYPTPQGNYLVADDTLAIDMVLEHQAVHIVLSPKIQDVYSTAPWRSKICDGESLYQQAMAIIK